MSRMSKADKHSWKCPNISKVPTLFLHWVHEQSEVGRWDRGWILYCQMLYLQKEIGHKGGIKSDKLSIFISLGYWELEAQGRDKKHERR